MPSRPLRHARAAATYRALRPEGELLCLAVATLIDRMTSAGISDERARAYIQDGWVRSGETVLTDPEAEQEAYFVIAPGVTQHQTESA